MECELGLDRREKCEFYPIYELVVAILIQLGTKETAGSYIW